MVLLSDLDLREETSIQLQSRREMIESLFEVTILKVCLTQFGISCYKNEEVFLVDIHEEFT